MDEAEQAQLAELDDTVTVYRGVTTINSDNLLALSWTLDYETADWFARRFDEDGTVYKAQIDKEHIFALFNGRDESEVVLDPKYLKDITQAQEPMDEYDTIFVEFPIWWYIAPTIVNAFLESYDLTGKTIIPFATSGGSGMGKTNEALKPSCTGATLLEGKVWKSTAKKEELSVWADSLACR